MLYYMQMLCAFRSQFSNEGSTAYHPACFAERIVPLNAVVYLHNDA